MVGIDAEYLRAETQNVHLREPLAEHFSVRGVEACEGIGTRASKS